jgi:hypothetical protein
MKKDILAKAISLADKSKARPEKIVIAQSVTPLFVKKPTALVLSERLYTRITPGEMARLKETVGTMFPVGALLRDLLIKYLNTKETEHAIKRKPRKVR